MNPNVDPAYLADAKVIRFKSFDGLEIPAVYYKPPHASSKNRVPALVRVHGGPGGQARVGYRASNQYLLNHGCAILDINNRGSSGYGKTFQTLDDQAHGEGDLDDCVWAINWLQKQNHVDGEKIGIVGASYGGYMVMAALAFRPDAFDVGVNIFGVTNWLRTLKSIPPWWESAKESLYKEMGNPNTQEDYLYSISPLFHAKNIKKPVLVLQGANDPRVLQVESDEMVEAVRKQGVPVEYIVFPDEGHGFAKKKNQITSNEAILKFLDQYLKGVSE
jgi:dipeptidyl aminopeptidase/acylaminoacyl peptidase